MVFDAFTRIQGAVLVFPWNGNIQPYGGIGLVLETLSNAQVNSTMPTTVQNQFVSDHPGPAPSPWRWQACSSG